MYNMASNTASNITGPGAPSGGPGGSTSVPVMGQQGQLGSSIVTNGTTSGAGSSGSTIVAGSIPPGGPAPVFHHEFLEANAAAAAAAATAVCFCHRFLNPFGGGSLALTTTGYVPFLYTTSTVRRK